MMGFVATLAALVVGAPKSAAIGEAEALARPTVPAKPKKKAPPKDRVTRNAYQDYQSPKGQRRRAYEAFWFEQFGERLSSRQYVRLRKAIQRHNRRTQDLPGRDMVAR